MTNNSVNKLKNVAQAHLFFKPNKVNLEFTTLRQHIMHSSADLCLPVRVHSIRV